MELRQVSEPKIESWPDRKGSRSESTFSGGNAWGRSAKRREERDMGREEKKKPAEKSGQRRVHERGIEERLGGRRRGGGGRRRREAWRADMAEEAVEEIEGSWSGDKRAPELPASLSGIGGRAREFEG